MRKASYPAGAPGAESRHAAPTRFDPRPLDANQISSLRSLRRAGGPVNLPKSHREEPMAAGSWSLAEELFARGDPGFVDELRRVHFAERLGDFASRWLADPRPFARQALLDYLSRPLNAFRHEPLVKRLFKLAEKA